MMVRLMSALRAAPVIVGLVVVIVGLHFSARLGLRGPSGLGADELRAWFDDPVTAIATVLRWVGLVLAYYLLVICGTIAIRQGDLDQTRLRYVVPAGLAPALGVLLGIGAVATPLAAHMSRQHAPIESAASDTLVLRELGSSLLLQSLDTNTSPAIHPMTDARGPERHQQPEAQGSEPQQLWNVEPGDSFWSIAEENLRDQWNVATLTDSQIAEHWRDLIDANRDRLTEPGNPDLLYPGQELLLPDVPNPPT